MNGGRVEPRAGWSVALCLLTGMLCGPVATASAGEVGLAVQIGRALPFYKQSFALDPGGIVPSELPISTSGGFDLELGGGLSLSGALSWRFAGAVGLEARVDAAEVELEVTGGRVSSDLGDLVPGLPSIPVSGDLSGETSIDRLTPVSLNLQLAVGKEVRFVVSGGASYIPATTVAATVQARLAVTDIPGLPPITLPGLSVTAAATLEGGLGGNLGAGLRIGVGPHVALAAEGRAFGFPTRELRWGAGSGRPSPIEEALAEALDPIEFRYGFFQATAGLAITF
jgi:hypothetical protein